MIKSLKTDSDDTIAVMLDAMISDSYKTIPELKAIEGVGANGLYNMDNYVKHLCEKKDFTTDDIKRLNTSKPYVIPFLAAVVARAPFGKVPTAFAANLAIDIMKNIREQGQKYFDKLVDERNELLKAYTEDAPRRFSEYPLLELKQAKETFLKKAEAWCTAIQLVIKERDAEIRNIEQWVGSNLENNVGAGLRIVESMPFHDKLLPEAKGKSNEELKRILLKFVGTIHGIDAIIKDKEMEASEELKKQQGQTQTQNQKKLYESNTLADKKYWSSMTIPNKRIISAQTDMCYVGKIIATNGDRMLQEVSPCIIVGHQNEAVKSIGQVDVGKVFSVAYDRNNNATVKQVSLSREGNFIEV